MGRAWDDLVNAIQGLPGVGPKMAERIGLFLVRNREGAHRLQLSIAEAQARLRRCSLCGDFVETETGPCGRCLDSRRDARVICVVEESGDLAALERTRAFQGRYHVLGGALSALDGVGPDELRIPGLLDRVRSEGTEEVILATNPTIEGETTAAYLADLLKGSGARLTRLASGLPSGSVIQYADEHTLAQALDGRRAVS